MTPYIFVTGNPNKATQFSEWVGMDIAHQQANTDELQSTDLAEVVTHKAHRAFEIIGAPVIVEDVSMVFHAIDPLPGPFIKWFNQLGYERLCRLLDSFEDKTATATIIYALYDGIELQQFVGQMHGSIVDHPRGTGGFGFDQIFMNDGFTVTRAEMTQDDYAATSYRKQAIDQLAVHLRSLNFAS